MKLKLTSCAALSSLGLLLGCGAHPAGHGALPSSVQATPFNLYFQAIGTGQYLSAQNSGGGAITATAPWTRGWEQFTVYDTTNNQLSSGDLVYVAASDGLFLSADGGGGGALSATAAVASGWEAFSVERFAGPGAISQGDSVALKTLLKGNYVSAIQGGGGEVNATAPWARGWETFVVSFAGGSNGGGSGGEPPDLEQILSRSSFDSMFPNRNSFYTYDGLLQSTLLYPAFATTGSLDDRKREVAAFLANVNHETGGLYYIDEIEKADYCGGGCPCADGKQYYGRGPIQISWNSNYCAASEAIFGDPEVLRTDPDRVSREPSVAWATALWFWTSTDCHNDIVNNRDFGATIRTVNGPVECGGLRPDEVQDRVDAYLNFCALLGVDPGSSLYC
jgi:predicted chitinase